jgi:hypothetical protein
MSIYEDYRDHLFIALFEDFKSLSDWEQKEFFSVIEKNIIGDGTLNRYIAKTEKSKYLSILYYGFTEIDRTYSNLQDIEGYIKRFPYKNSQINPINYLHYHIGNYLNEIYILENRLIDYPKKIIRFNRNSPNFMANKISIIDFEKVIKSSFANIVQIRGRHVHRYHFLDDDLERIQILSSLPSEDMKEISNMDEFNKVIQQYQVLYLREIQGKWHKKIIADNIVIKKFLDTYFDFLNLLVFDKNNEVIFFEKI